MKPMSLYEINSLYAYIYDQIAEAEGEVTEEQLQLLDQISTDKEVKYENYALMIKNTLATAAAIKEEKARLATRQSSLEQLADRLKDRLSQAMQSMGDAKFETARCKISFRSSTSVNITDEKAVPEEFIIMEPHILKGEIKKALNDGQAVPGCELSEKQNIQIK